MASVDSTSFAELDGLSLPGRAYASFSRSEVSRFGRRALGDRRRLWAVRSVEPVGLHGLYVVSERALTLAQAIARPEGWLSRARGPAGFAGERAPGRRGGPQGVRRHEPGYQRWWRARSAPSSLRARHDGDGPEPNAARQERAARDPRRWRGAAAARSEAAVVAAGHRPYSAPERRTRSQKRGACQTSPTDRL